MPITAPPALFPVSSPVDSTSPDGHIRAVVDPTYGGVLLLVDYSLSDGALPQPLSTPFSCTVYRQTPDGTIDRVRGGDPYVNYGAAGDLYDQEGPLNTLCTYWAVPVLQDGTDGPPCAGVQVLTSSPRPDMWLITPDAPNAAVNVGAHDSRKGTLASRNDLQGILGAANPSATLETRAGITSTMQFYTTSQSEFEAVVALVNQNIIFRKSTTWERADGWFIVGDASFEPATSIYSGWFLWTVALTSTDRPPTAGQFVSIPGDTLADRLAQFATFNDVIKRQFSGNLLLEEDSEFDSLVSWGAGSNTTVSQDIVIFRKGIGSMKLVATAAGAVSANSPYKVPVTAGQVYEFTMWAFSAQGGRTVNFEVDWKDAANNYLGYIASTPVVLGAAQWTPLKFKVTVPVNVTYATLITIGTATHAGDIFNYDVVTFGPLP